MPDDAVAHRQPLDWDATTYDRIASPQTRWGTDVLGRLDLRGDETVLDAGCGTGRVTERLAERLAAGRVVALDGSQAMVEAARGRLARFGDRVTFVVADLGAPLPIPDSSLDAILSTATFHWVRDHDALFRHLAAALRPGGRLVAQCGGEGNIASIRAAIAETGDSSEGPWTFASPEATIGRLQAAGFVDAEAWLTNEPTAIEPGAPLREYLRTVVLPEHLVRIPEADRDAFVDAVASRLAGPVIDYVRLNILATRG